MMCKSKTKFSTSVKVGVVNDFLSSKNMIPGNPLLTKIEYLYLKGCILYVYRIIFSGFKVVSLLP